MNSENKATKAKTTAEEKSSPTTTPPIEFTEKFTKIKAGTVNFITFSDEVNLLYGRSAFEHEWALSSCIAGMEPPENVSLSSVLTGSKKNTACVEALRKQTTKITERCSTFFLSEKRDFLFLSTEGTSALSANLKSLEGNCVSFYQPLVSFIRPDELDALDKLKKLAAQHAKTFLVFASERGFDEKRLGEATYDNLFHVAGCVPDENVTFACAVECQTLTSLFGEHDSQKTFIQGKWVNGNFRVRGSRFTGTDPVAREMWKMANEGASVTELAFHFKKNKSNISRALQKLPRRDTNLTKETTRKKST